ncbi:MAG: DEAD/DEAH box helicase family protein [Magnetococcales bacterium]|nr:DEAD/DEAH box helicase family protein [Magnetococcales bacterium]
MNRHVNTISGRLSLRPPQRRSLEILDRITEILPPRKENDLQAALAVIHSEFPTVSDFEREFPSLCFALATGVGKTRLMGAFITYLHLAHGLRNFFVLAPNLTIYNKLIADFTPNTPKYVFKGIAEFVLETPIIVTGDNYEQGSGVARGGRTPRLPSLEQNITINIFNISKINSEVRGGKAPRIKRLSEYIGESYFDYLAGLEDLVLLMDESHRYRASAGVRAINELKPVLGLELTATPFVEVAKGAIPFKNVIFDYPLGQAMADGFVKEPAVVTRKNFNPAGMSPEELEKMKLEDGIRLHESIKVALETYARETGNAIVKPFLLVIARDTTHAGQILERVQSDGFFRGQYRDKVIQVDSSQTGAQEDEMINRLLKVEHTDEPTEIVIHVNMLKEGWDVTNLYTIVPLRAANARILIEQSIGRGLRLPYGKRTGVTTVDRLNIVAHDKFQEIIDEANRPESAIHLQQIILPDETQQQKTETVVSQSTLASRLGFQPNGVTASTRVAGSAEQPLFQSPEERKIAQIAYEVIRKMETRPQVAPSVNYLQQTEIQTLMVREVEAQYRPVQMELEGTVEKPDIASIVAKTTELVVQQTIDIPRINVVPQGEVLSGYDPFSLDLSGFRYQTPEGELWIKHLRTGTIEELGLVNGGVEELSLENYIVAGLVDFDDVSYDDHADLLYDLARQVINHFLGYLEEEDIRNILRNHQKEISRAVYVQMQAHHWEKAVGYDVVISGGFSELKPCAYTVKAGQSPLDYRQSPVDKSNMSRYLFGHFKKSLYTVQKFDSDAERKMAVILEREALKWFKPARGQFQIYYKWGVDHHEYQPDFVAETADCIYMLEPKAANQMEDGEVREKAHVAVTWCQRATEYATRIGGKPWQYLLIPHDAIIESMTLEGLSRLYMRSFQIKNA